MSLFVLSFFFLLVQYVSLAREPFCPDPRQSPSAIRAAHRCLPLLRTHPSRYSACQTKICYLFLQEAPFIILPQRFRTRPTDPSLYTAFPCGSPHKLDPAISGVAFSLHNLTASATELCIWAGLTDQCTFNAMIDLIDIAADQGYNFAVTGILLQMPERECRHFPSAPIVDDAMVVIGHHNDHTVSASAAWYRLTGPFDLNTWLLFATVVLLQIILCFCIARRFPSYEAHPWNTAWRIFLGDLSSSPTDGGHSERGHVLASRLFRISFVLSLTIFVMLYELAAVNFLLRQQQLEIGKSVRSLSSSELAEYAVLKNSALERVWNESVNPAGTKYDGSNHSNIPWQRCKSGTECIEWLGNESRISSFTVTFEIIGQYQLKSQNKCDALSVYATQDILYHFSANWLYNRNVNARKRKEIDTELTQLRVSGTIRDLIDDYIGEKRCEQHDEIQITLFIGLLPILVFVVVPLILAGLLLLPSVLRYP